MVEVVVEDAVVVVVIASVVEVIADISTFTAGTVIGVVVSGELVDNGALVDSGALVNTGAAVVTGAFVITGAFVEGTCVLVTVSALGTVGYKN